MCHLIFTLPCFAHTHSVHMLTPYSLVCVLPRFQSTDFVISHVARKTQRLQFYIIVQELHVHVTSVRAGGNESLAPKNGRAWWRETVLKRFLRLITIWCCFFRTKKFRVYLRMITESISNFMVCVCVCGIRTHNHNVQTHLLNYGKNDWNHTLPSPHHHTVTTTRHFK